MFVLYAFLIAILFVTISYIYIKTFQLENYRLENYWKKAIELDFAFGKKTPLVFTNRIKRLIFCTFLWNFFIFMLFFGVIPSFWANFVLVILFVLFSPFWILMPFLIMIPIERQIKQNFVKKAKNKLKSCSCKTIAITGSYGKTSTKEILYQILSEEFDVCASPKSYNTPMGVCKTILENLKETDDFLIVEFGARRKGDIEELCKLVDVDFGIITPLGNCHLETFGSLENLENTKYELCESAKDVVVFNGKSEGSKKLFCRYPRKKYLVCEQNSFAYAKDIKTDGNGSLFTLVLDGAELACKTSLLGKANIDNIVVAAAMAHLLGESHFDIVRAIEKLKQTPHRLQMIKGFVSVIDDSYNSNLAGFKEALSVLATFEGRKIVVSPGIVELGKSQFETNVFAGREVSKVADVFVVMNEVNKKALLQGVEGKCKTICAKTREEQKAILKSLIKVGDVVLFENDLPDNMK